MTAHLDKFIMYDTVKLSTKDNSCKNQSYSQDNSQYSKWSSKKFHDYFMVLSWSYQKGQVLCFFFFLPAGVLKNKKSVNKKVSGVSECY